MTGGVGVGRSRHSSVSVTRSDLGFFKDFPIWELRWVSHVSCTTSNVSEGSGDLSL